MKKGFSSRSSCHFPCRTRADLGFWIFNHQSTIRNPKSQRAGPSVPSEESIEGLSFLRRQESSFSFGRVGFSPPISINRKSAIRNPKSSCPRPGFPLSFLLVRISSLSACGGPPLTRNTLSFIISFSANSGPVVARPELNRRVEGPAICVAEGIRNAASNSKQTLLRRNEKCRKGGEKAK